jgi:signal recognition particle GTPase
LFSPPIICVNSDSTNLIKACDAIRQVRRALLEADVALEVIKVFLDKVQEKALGLNTP